MTRRFLAVAAVSWVLLAAPGVGRAQTPFALQNIGQRAETDDARMVARGFGMTVTDSLHPGFKNVASLASLRHVVVKFTGYGELVDSSNDTGARRTYRTYAPNIRVALPVLKNRLAVTAGFAVDRTTAYQTSRDTTIYFPFEENPDTRASFQYIREGSLFHVPLGVTFQALPGVSLGAAVNLVGGSNIDTASDRYGRLDENGDRSFPGILYQHDQLIHEETYSGTSVTWALLLAPGRRFRIGASWTPAHDVEVKRTIELQGVAARARSSFTMSLPGETRAGAEARIVGRWRVGADLHYAGYSAYRGRSDWEQAARDEFAWSAGLERIQARERRGGWSNLPLRLGLAYRRWAYTIGGADVEERSYSVGTGFPFSGNLGNLDLALTYGRVGSRAANGYESDVWRLTVSMTGLEAWW